MISNKTFDLKVIFFPWIIYLLLVLIFDIKYKYYNPIIIYIICLSLTFSTISYLSGRSFAEFKNLKTNKNLSKENIPYYRILIILSLLGSFGSVFYDLIDLKNNTLFKALIYQNKPLMYSLRITNNLGPELVGSNLKFICKFIFPLSFFFYIYNFQKKNIKLSYLIIILTFSSLLISGGRFYFLYFFIIYIFSRIDSDKEFNLFSKKKIFIIIIFFYILLLTMSSRVPEQVDTLEFYKTILGVVNIRFEYLELGIFNTLKNNFLALIIYLTHSLNFLSYYYETFSFDSHSNGSYTFNLLFRIINKIFDLNLSLNSFYDPTFGRYSTFIKDLVADFGIIGLLIIFSFYSFFFGFSSYYKKYYYSFEVIYYWLLTFFILAPLVNIISSGFINLMFLFLIIYAFLEIIYKNQTQHK